MIGKVAFTLFMVSTFTVAQPLHDGIASFREAYRDWDSAKFWNATRDFSKAVAAEPKSAAAHVWLGTAHFHRMLQIENRPATPQLRAAAAGDRDAAIAALERAVELDVTQAEAHAMLGTLYGKQIDGAVSAMRYGPKVQKHQKLALKHGAKSPRVQYLLGVGRLKTADKQAEVQDALKSLLLAETLYDAEAKMNRPADAPTWGKDACLVFIGDAYSRLHKAKDARDYYRKALQERPDNQLAKAGLSKLE